MKKFVVCLLTIMLIFGAFFIDQDVYAAESNGRDRLIHLVYDDSGSMVYDWTNMKPLESWSQAKYAMEVFAAMMGEQDTMKIYPMSSYSYYTADKKSGSWEETISISGKDKAADRVKKIDNMNGDQGNYMNTPLQSVIHAGDDLKQAKASEKWLIILTDGAFDDGKGSFGKMQSVSDVKNKITGYAGKDGIKVIYVAIGKNATSLKSQKNANFIPYEADSGNILKTITEAASTVFNYQSIPVSGSKRYSFTPDIPVSKLIVFAQGQNASVSSLTFNQKNLDVKPEQVEVSVSKDTKNKPKLDKQVIVADGLKGQLQTYTVKDEKKPFAAGTYSFDSNVEDIQVYYEPGVDVQVVLENEDGTKINLSGDDDVSISEGAKKIHLKVIDPLTGEEIKVSDSALLDESKLSIMVRNQEGDTQTYGDGETVLIAKGEIYISGRISFKGNKEKKTQEKKLKVTEGKISVEALEKKYTLFTDSLTLDQDLLVKVSEADQPIDLPLDAIQFKVTGIDGLEWTTEKTSESGIYKLIPNYGGNNSASNISIGSQDIEIEAIMNVSGFEKTGSASTEIVTELGSSIDLMLELEMPEATISNEKTGQMYMFDPGTTGVDKAAPYILVKAKVKTGEGQYRELSEEEWNVGEKGFSYSSKSVTKGFLWKLIDLVCVQNLSFEAIKGDSISTYKLYLTGTPSTKIRPNNSELDVKLDIVLKNGVKEMGTSQGEVSVKPLSWLAYLLWFIIICVIVVLVLIFIIMEIRKNRFDKYMYPRTTALLTQNGIPLTPPLPDQVSKRKPKYRVLPPWKAEERKVTMKYNGYLDLPVTFDCVATGDGTFMIKPESLKKFMTYQNQVKFNGMNYKMMLESPCTFDINSDIIITISKGSIQGKVIMYFMKEVK